MPEKLKFRAMRVWGLKKLGRPIIAKTELSGRQKPLSPPSTKTFLGNGAEAEVIYECRADNRNATNASNVCILNTMSNVHFIFGAVDK